MEDDTGMKNTSHGSPLSLLTTSFPRLFLPSPPLPFRSSSLPLFLASILILLAFSQAGCLFYSGEIAQTRRSFEAEYPAARFKKEAMFDLGPLTLSMAGGLLQRWAREDFERIGPYLRDLRRVEVGVYEVENLPSPGAVNPSRLPVLREGGWEVAVRVREAEEHVWVLYRARRRSVRDVYVLTLGEDELVVIRLRGRFGRMATRLLETLPGTPP